MDARIVVDGSTLKPGNLGPATGSVWLDVDEISFPVHGWNDFVVVVLRWWAVALRRVLRGDRGPHEINFIDGPYLVELSGSSGDSWTLALFDTGRTRRMRSQHQVRPRELVNSLILGSESVLSACRDTACWSSDATALEEAAAALRKEVSRLRN